MDHRRIGGRARQWGVIGTGRARSPGPGGERHRGREPASGLGRVGGRSGAWEGGVRTVIKVERVMSYATPRSRGSRLHGPTHWARVASFGAQLSQETLGADAHVVSVFAMLHDTRRFTDGHDPDHGRRAAEMALELRGVLYEITDEKLELLVEAIARHADGLLSQDPTIGCCWDADRLDLPRCGIRVDPTMLSTEAGKRKTRVVDRLMGHGDAGGVG